MSLVPMYGNAVTGENRFARPALEKRLASALSSSSVKMFGLRRIGKSTLRLWITEKFQAEGKPYAYVDGQGLHSLSDLLSRLYNALPGEGGLFRQAFSAISTGPVKTALDAVAAGAGHEQTVLSAYWQTVSDAIKKTLRAPGPKPMLIIDEFTYLLDNMVRRGGSNGIAEVDKLLASMREWRGEGMKMLLTGSIGFTGLARKHGLNRDHLNDLQPFLVPELTNQEVREFIHQATETRSSGRWTSDHTDEFLRQVGVYYPCFLVLGLIEVGTEHPSEPSEFEEIFSERVRPHLHAEFFSQFDRRFKNYTDLPNSEQANLILPALKVIMASDGNCKSQSLPCPVPFNLPDLRSALDMLVDDGFVHFSETVDGERLWKPASRLAKLWWKRSELT